MIYEKVNLEQGSDDWRAFRNVHVGASDLPAIMGLSPWKSAFKLWQEKKGLKKSDFINSKMQKGIDGEPLARDWLEKELKVRLPATTIFRTDEPWAMASLDGLSEDGKTACEIKVINEKSHSDTVIFGTVPKMYICQIQWQLYVSGLDEIVYCSYQNDDDATYLVVKRDDDAIKEMVRKARAFFLKLSSDNFNDDVKLDMLCSQFIQVDRRIKELEKDKSKLKEDIFDKLDGQFLENAFVTVFQVTRVGSYDIDAIASSFNVDKKDLEKFRKLPTTFTSIKTKKVIEE